MAVKFEFTVSDGDADIIFWAMTNFIVGVIELKAKEMNGNKRPEVINQYNERIQYLKDLKSRMLNTHVEDE
jgi:hypothetical protein